MNSIILTCESFTQEDVKALNQELSNLENGFEIFLSTHLSFNQYESMFIAMLFAIQGSIINNAIYDSIKFSINRIVSRFKSNSKTKGVTVEMCLNGNKDTIFFDFELSEVQKEKIVDAALKKMLKDI